MLCSFFLKILIWKTSVWIRWCFNELSRVLEFPGVSFHHFHVYFSRNFKKIKSPELLELSCNQFYWTVLSFLEITWFQCFDVVEKIYFCDDGKNWRVCMDMLQCKLLSLEDIWPCCGLIEIEVNGRFYAFHFGEENGLGEAPCWLNTTIWIIRIIITTELCGRPKSMYDNSTAVRVK